MLLLKRCLTAVLYLIIVVFWIEDANSATKTIVTDFNSVFSKVDGLKETENFRKTLSDVPDFQIIARDSINRVLGGMGLGVTGPFAVSEIKSVLETLDGKIFFTGEFKEEFGYIYFTYLCFRNDDPSASIGERIRWRVDRYDGFKPEFIHNVFRPEEETIPYSDKLMVINYSELSLAEAELFIEVSKGRMVKVAGEPFALTAPDGSCSAEYSADQFGLSVLNICGNIIEVDFIGGFSFTPSSKKFIFGDDSGNIVLGNVLNGETKLVHKAYFDFNDMEGRPSPFFINNHQFISYGAFKVGAWWLYELGEKIKF